MQFILIFTILSFNLFANSYTQSQYDKGKMIYKKTCISCHSKDGSGNLNIKLLIKPRNLKKSILNKDQMFNIIKYGSHTYGSKSALMPAFKYLYSDKQLKNVVYYIQNSFKPNIYHQIKYLSKKINYKNIIIDDKDIGKKIFQKKCSLCHGANGDGNSQYSDIHKKNRNFIFPYNLQKIILSQRQIFLFIKYGGKYWGGSTDDMPSWSSKYDDKTIKSIAKYVTNIIKK